jgi:hypothetical protein
METSEVIYRTRPQPSGGTIIVGLIGILMLFSKSTLVVGLVLLALAVWSWRLAEVTITKRYVKVKRGLLSGTTELQLAKLETVQIGSALGGAKPVALVGTGGTVYKLGTIPNVATFREHLETAMDASRGK